MSEIESIKIGDFINQEKVLDIPFSNFKEGYIIYRTKKFNSLFF